jgi:hypothetical protein
MIATQIGDDPAKAHKQLSDAVAAVETKVGQVQKLITNAPPVVSGATTADQLASLIAALESLGLVKDGT